RRGSASCSAACSTCRSPSASSIGAPRTRSRTASRGRGRGSWRSSARGGESCRSVQHVEAVPQSFPWRRATLVVGVIAAVELLVLLGIAVVRLAPSHAGTRPAAAAPTVTAQHHAAPKAPPVPTHPLRARSAVHVLVLNGNGEQGAASGEASRLQVSGYRISGARNAARD